MVSQGIQVLPKLEVQGLPGGPVPGLPGIGEGAEVGRDEAGRHGHSQRLMHQGCRMRR